MPRHQLIYHLWPPCSAVTSTVLVQWTEKRLINSACGHVPNVRALIVKEASIVYLYMVKCLTWPQVIAILCNFEIQAEINVILNETCRSLKQQSSSPWPFMPEFRLLCHLLHSQMLSLSLPCNWLVRPWNYVLRKSKQVHRYMVLWATTRSGAYTVLLKIVWCVYSNWRLVVRLKVESRGLRAPAWEQFCHLWPENIMIYFPNVYSVSEEIHVLTPR